MVKYTQGNILQAEVEAIVNAVNCVGVMGRGLALQFRIAFPDNYKAYSLACAHKEVIPGQMFVFMRQKPPKFIINFPTKRHWRNSSRIKDIEIGLEALVEEVMERQIKSIAIPALGCGEGGLEWDEVRPKIVNAFAKVIDVEAIIYDPMHEGPVRQRAQ